MADSGRFRVAIFCGVSSSASWCARSAFESEAGRSCRIRRSELGALAGAEFVEAGLPSSRALRAAAGRTPCLQDIVGYGERLQRDSRAFPWRP